MPAFAEEIFGPVAPVIPFTDDEEAIALANATEYGLAAAVQSGSPERAAAVAERLNAGMVHINDQTVNEEAGPVRRLRAVQQRRPLRRGGAAGAVDGMAMANVARPRRTVPLLGPWRYIDEEVWSPDGGERWALAPEQSTAQAPRAPEQWHLDKPGKGTFEAWADILSVTHVGFDVESSATPPRFRGAVTRRRMGDLMLVDCASSPCGPRGTAHRGRRRHRRRRRLSVRAPGVERVRDPRMEQALTAGDVIVWNGWQPVDAEVTEPFTKRTLIVPSDRVLSVCPRLEEARAMSSVEQSPAARLLMRYLDALAEELPWLDESGAAAAADAALELLRAAVEPSVPSTRSARRSAIRADVRRYIRAHLQDALLGPESIARAHSISVRTLHALFEDCDESVAGLVRRERLARCHEDLLAPAAARSPRSRSAGASAMRRTSRACSSASSARRRAKCAPRRSTSRMGLIDGRAGWSPAPPTASGGPARCGWPPRAPMWRWPTWPPRARPGDGGEIATRAARPSSWPATWPAADAHALVAHVVAARGRLDFAVNNAGVGPRPAGRHQRRGLRPRHRRQPARHLPGHEARSGRCSTTRCPAAADRQHVLQRRPARRPPAGRLRRLQARHSRADEDAAIEYAAAASASTRSRRRRS